MHRFCRTIKSDILEHIKNEHLSPAGFDYHGNEITIIIKTRKDLNKLKWKKFFESDARKMFTCLMNQN